MSDSSKRNLVLLTLLVCCCLFFIWLAHRGIFPVCPSMWLAGVPCPGCGGVRSTLALARGDLATALWHNPLTVLFVIFVGVSVAWVVLDVVRDRNTYWRIYKLKWSCGAIFIAVGVLIANWIWNIVKYM